MNVHDRVGYLRIFSRIRTRAVDPDPRGSAFIFTPGSGFYNDRKLFIRLFFFNCLSRIRIFWQLDPDLDPHSENRLGPDHQKMNADPQP